MTKSNPLLAWVEESERRMSELVAKLAALDALRADCQGTTKSQLEELDRRMNELVAKLAAWQGNSTLHPHSRTSSQPRAVQREQLSPELLPSDFDTSNLVPITGRVH